MADGPPEFALPRGGKPRRPWRLPVLAGLAALVTASGVFVVKARLERDPLEGVPPAARAEMAVRAAEASGDPAVVERSLMEALAHLEEARAAAPGDVSLGRARLAVLDRLGGNALRHGTEADALRFAKHAADEALAVLRANASDERAVLDALATANTYADRAEKARVGAADRQRVLMDAAVAAGQGTPGSAAVLARTWLRAAQLATGAESSATWRKATEATDPQTPTLEGLALLVAAVETLSRLDEAEDTRPIVASARALAERLQAARPGDATVERELEARHLTLAEVSEKTQDWQGARRFLETVVQMRRARLARNASDVETRRELVRVLSNLGVFLSVQGALDQARETHTEAAKLTDGLEGEGRRTAMVAYGNLAQTLGKLEKWDDARAAASKAVTLAAALEKDFDAGDDAALDLANARLRHARLLRAPGGDRGRALSLAREALAALDKHFPGDAKPESRRDEIRAGLTDLLAEPR